MNHKNARRGNTQQVIKNNPVNIPELVSGSSTQAITQQKLQQQTLKMPKQVRQYPYLTKFHGFTARSVTPQCRYAGYSGRPGFILRRHAELVSASSRSMKKEEALNKSSFRAPLRSGFTLIELLVVVLIIGILAALIRSF